MVGAGCALVIGHGGLIEVLYGENDGGAEVICTVHGSGVVGISTDHSG